MIIFKLEDNMDESLKLNWKNSRRDLRELPKYTDLLSFMERRALNFEYLKPSKKKLEINHTVQAVKPRAFLSQIPRSNYASRGLETKRFSESSSMSCPGCKKNHFAFNCPVFL